MRKSEIWVDNEGRSLLVTAAGKATVVRMGVNGEPLPTHIYFSKTIRQMGNKFRKWGWVRV